MPVKHTSLDPVKVGQEMKRRGYGINVNRIAALHLTKAIPGQRFAVTGGPVRQLLRPISHRQYEEIEKHCVDLTDACDQFEAIANGVELAPRRKGALGIDPQQMEKIVAARTENAVANATRSMSAQLAEQNEMIQQMRRELSEQSARKKPGPKPKGKRRNVVAETRQAIAEPELTPEQEAQLARVMAQDRQD